MGARPESWCARRERLKRIKTDSLGSGYLEGLSWTILYPIPGRAPSGLTGLQPLRREVVILVDGSHALIVPVELSMELQSRRLLREFAGTFIRVLRYLSLLLSLLPGSYVALLISPGVAAHGAAAAHHRHL